MSRAQVEADLTRALVQSWCRKAKSCARSCSNTRKLWCRIGRYVRMTFELPTPQKARGQVLGFLVLGFDIDRMTCCSPLR